MTFCSSEADVEMFRICPATLTCLLVLLVLFSLYGADGASLSDGQKDEKATASQGGLSQIFLHDHDASNFFKRRGRRAVKTPDEISAEQTLRLAADERRRKYHENQRNDFEDYAEEESDEQDERSRNSAEQWRQYHDDGLDSPY